MEGVTEGRQSHDGSLNERSLDERTWLRGDSHEEGATEGDSHARETPPIPHDTLNGASWTSWDTLRKARASLRGLRVPLSLIESGECVALEQGQESSQWGSSGGPSGFEGQLQPHKPQDTEETQWEE